MQADGQRDIWPYVCRLYSHTAGTCKQAAAETQTHQTGKGSLLQLKTQHPHQLP